MTYEFMEHTVVAGCFGLMIGMGITGIAYWITSFIFWVKKKVKQRFHHEEETENKE